MGMGLRIPVPSWGVCISNALGVDIIDIGDVTVFSCMSTGDRRVGEYTILLIALVALLELMCSAPIFTQLPTMSGSPTLNVFSVKNGLFCLIFPTSCTTPGFVDNVIGPEPSPL